MLFKCEWCSKEFDASPSRRVNKHTFCSKECEAEWKKKPRIKCVCKVCSREFEILESYSTGQYCSQKCMGEAYKKENAQTAMVYTIAGWDKTRKEALNKTGGTCAICSTSEGIIDVHHIIPFRLMGKHESDNLIPLCRKCHSNFEKDTIGIIGDRCGHPDFTRKLLEMWMLHLTKNHDYAHGGDPMGNFKRVATIFSLYPNLKLSDPAVVALVYAMKQVDAVLWMLSSGHSAKVEGFHGRLQDIAVYSTIADILLEESNKSK
jgi:5-methylcytosine-specific restriction endonuclease McrA